MLKETKKQISLQISGLNDKNFGKRGERWRKQNRSFTDQWFKCKNCKAKERGKEKAGLSQTNGLN